MQRLDQKAALEIMLAQLQELKINHFTGSLILQARNHLTWKLCFRMGFSIWATGGAYPYERWRRHLQKYCPGIKDTELAKIAPPQTYQEYIILAKLWQQKRIVLQPDLVELIKNIVIEVIFDAIQYSVKTGENLHYSTDSSDRPNLLIALLRTSDISEQAQLNWESWYGAGLENYSPNLFPVIERPKILQEKAPLRVYQVIRNLADGTKTLRNLAAKSGWDLIDLTRRLIPLVEAGAIELSSVPTLREFELPSQPEKKTSTPTKLKKIHQVSVPSETKSSQTDSSRLLVACVDDSPLVCKALEQIITPQGYRFISITDSAKAVPMLLKCKPDFIFLDLMMPVTNGYELCGRLRKTPRFKKVPIVILTGRDGLIDRMRAKLVGSTSFLSKPVEKEPVLTIIDKYLPVQYDLPQNNH